MLLTSCFFLKLFFLLVVLFCIFFAITTFFYEKKVKVLVAQSCPTLCNPMECVAYHAPLSMEFSRQEYWSGCHALLQGIFPSQGLNLGLLHYRQSLYSLIHQGSLYIYVSTLRFFSHIGHYRALSRVCCATQ